MVDKRDLRALKPQTDAQRFQAIRLTVAGIVLIPLGVLLIVIQLALKQVPAFGIGSVVFGVGAIAFSLYRRIARQRRIAALHASAASVEGYQLNTTYSQTEAAKAAAEAIRAAPRPSRRRLPTAVLVLGALILLGITVFHAVHRTPDRGTVVPAGTAQEVHVTGDYYKKTDAAGVADVTVTGVRRATSADLGDVELTPEQKKETPYFVDYTAKRVSGTFDPDAPGIFSEYNWSATESDGSTTSAVIAILPPAACSSDDGRLFASGTRASGCVIFVSPKPLASATFEESAGAYSWDLPAR